MKGATFTSGVQNPTVSIVLPTYRRATMLERAIKTVLDQSVADWELIVVDYNGTGHEAQLAAAGSAIR